MGNKNKKAGEGFRKNAPKSKSNSDSTGVDCGPQEVNPLITITGKKVVLICKQYLVDLGEKPHRLELTLKTDRAFDGNGTLECNKQDTVKVCKQAQGGEVLAWPLSLKGNDLTKGKKLYFQGVNPSTAKEDIKLTLSISGGSKACGPAVHEKITAVEVELNVCKRRTSDASDPEKLAEDKKLDPGRTVLLQNNNFAERAMLVVEQAKPKDFEGKLKLNCTGAKLALFDKDDEKPANGQTGKTLPLLLDNKSIPDKGRAFWLEGKTKSAALRDTGFTLEIKDVKNLTGDKIAASVLKAPIDVYKHRTQAASDTAKLVQDKKVDPGRILHLQEGKHHARAKILIGKIEPGNFECELTLSVWKKDREKNGCLKLYRAADETPHDGQTSVALPHTIAYRDDMLENARTFWVEGAEVSEKAHDIQIRLGVKDVDAGCDRIGMTVVKVKEVRPFDEYPDASDDYTNNKYERYINLPYAEASTMPFGRMVKFKAELTKKISGIKLHFMLAPERNNRTSANNGFDFPATWNIPDALKHSDVADPVRSATAADPTSKLHHSAMTNADGIAEKEMQLSQVGGDVFYAGVYLNEEPYLGKFVDGDNNLGKRKPRLSKKIRVWRKVWAQITKIEPCNPPDPAAAIQAMEKIKVRFVPLAFNEFPKAGAPNGIYYPKWQLKGLLGGKGEMAVIGRGNNDLVFTHGLRNADDVARPKQVHVVVFDNQWDSKRTAMKTFRARSRATKGLRMSRTIVTPALGGNDIKVIAQYRIPPAAAWLEIPAANITISRGRLSTHHLNVTLPVGVNPSMANRIPVRLMVSGVDGPYLGESPTNKRDIMTVYNSWMKKDYNDTICHEVGHSFNQTPRPGMQKGGPDHPNQADRGQGNHCTHINCIMYQQLDPLSFFFGKHKFCNVCKPYLLVEDFSVNIPFP